MTSGGAAPEARGGASIRSRFRLGSFPFRVRPAALSSASASASVRLSTAICSASPGTVPFMISTTLSKSSSALPSSGS